MKRTLKLVLKQYNIRLLLVLFLFFGVFHSGHAQQEVDVFRLQLGLGVNSPLDANLTPQFESKTINFPSIQLGFRYMFKNTLGAKLDVQYNRFSSASTSLPFKSNYSRLNLQGIYDVTDKLNFLSPRTSIFVHAGPGLSISKPLGIYNSNTYNFFNLNAGVEVEFIVSKRLSLFSDLNYTYAFASDDKYAVLTDGFSFNENMIQVTVGISVALSGCKYCE